jgi:two-component system sensor histidine kinase CpxA
VLDRGPGVPPEDLAKIFEPFFRADKSRDHAHGGQGIGLAITARVMELHAGSVEARNREGGGLEVILKLPLRERPEPAERQQPPARAAVPRAV